MQDQIPTIGFLKTDPDAVIPSMATPGAAASDLSAIIRNADGTVMSEGMLIQPMERKLIGTGFRMDIPAGFEVQIRPRSGLALKHGITVLNTPGTIDSDYKGPVMVLLVNLGNTAFKVDHLMRIAQMVVSPIVRFQISDITEMSASERGSGSFGSTGT